MNDAHPASQAPPPDYFPFVYTREVDLPRFARVRAEGQSLRKAIWSGWSYLRKYRRAKRTAPVEEIAYFDQQRLLLRWLGQASEGGARALHDAEHWQFWLGKTGGGADAMERLDRRASGCVLDRMRRRGSTNGICSDACAGLRAARRSGPCCCSVAHGGKQLAGQAGRASGTPADDR